ncbi:MAG: PLD nuclease N-terminal domain-containing protein [Patulibacter sp.]
MPEKTFSWDELSSVQRSAVTGAGALQIGLLVAALRDLRRRPADRIRGRKPLWVLASFVNVVGPLSYFAFGRRR